MAARLFCIFFALVGIPLNLVVLNRLGRLMQRGVHGCARRLGGAWQVRGRGSGGGMRGRAGNWGLSPVRALVEKCSCENGGPRVGGSPVGAAATLRIRITGGDVVGLEVR